MVTEALLAALLSAAPAEYKKVEETDGVLIEARPVEGAKLVELRLSTTTTRSVASLCATRMPRPPPPALALMMTG